MRCLPYGETAWLVVELDEPIQWAEGARQAVIFGVEEILPSEAAVVVRCTSARRNDVRARIETVQASPLRSPGNTVRIDVDYDGPDLAEVAALTGLDESEVVFRHESSVYTSSFCGVAPGFASLRGLDASLRLPRSARPRTTMPAGSVAIEGSYTAVYPSSCDAGWYVIGSTDVKVWDQFRDEPALLASGATVRFRSR